MIRRTTTLAAVLALGVLGAFGPTSAAAAPSAAWKLVMTPMPTNFAPGATAEYFLVATNVGGGPTSGPITIKATLPEKLKVLAAEAAIGEPGGPPDPECPVPLGTHTVTCTTKGEAAETLRSGRIITALIKVEVPLGTAEETPLAEASIEGGGATQTVSATAPTPIGPDPADFGFLPGFSNPLTNDDGFPTEGAGAHPYQLTADLAFPTEDPGNELTGAGHPRDIVSELPRGLLGNPAATPVLCTEAELTIETTAGRISCPPDSQVGVISITTGGNGIVFTEPSPLYNMVPPPGAAAELGFNAGGAGYFIHLVGGVRSDGDYGIFAASKDALALGLNPLFNIQAQIWGDPSSSLHDQIRSSCLFTGSATCKATKQKTAFLTMPSDCPGKPLTFKALADSWEEPGLFKETEYESADLVGGPVTVKDCDKPKFEPTISAHPTTNLTDSPSGLNFDLHQPQETDFEGLSTANLKDATITFPAGMAVNASQAGGLEACNSAQIGLTTAIGAAPIHFNKAPQSCPDAAKIGTLEVTSPLLVQRDEKHEVASDPETGEPMPEPLHGSVYIAKPFDNPFNSLIAVYLAIEDAKTGIVAKLAGRGELDPTTGQVSTTFEENPELPVEDFKVHLFGGARGAFITPPTCTTQTTSAQLTPWSAPEKPATQITDSFTPSAAPGGGPCPTSEAQMPNAPAFNAGTLSPAAGAFSPLVFKLAREDGSQRLTKLEATLPPGLSARLAGVAQCSEAKIAAAEARNHPNEGTLEGAAPSCPAASGLGVVTAGSGAGPTPFYVQGHAYLAGPYKGAPLSMVFITPAVAGPFDLGVVVVRAAIYIDPTTAQGRAVSDPLPTILQGIPLDLRSVALKLSRERFTFNPTSCDEEAFTGNATSALGQIAPLFQRFQAGGCKALPYKPKLTTRLFGSTHRGGHPRLRAVFTAKPGEANTARIVFALPRSEFIDQGHFRTICTRVQFAASQCPAGSVYGHVKAISPQVDYPLEGPIYLRSSVHKLPDVVAVLKGPPSQPVEVDLVGRVDSVHGGVRTTFETVPDAPVTKAIVTMQGAKKGLFENSTNICKGTHRVTLKLDGQNGKAHDSRPKLKADCPKPSKKKPNGKR